MKIRKGLFSDYPKLVKFDEFIGDRRLELQKGEIWVCDRKGDVAVGYVRISTDHFFSWPFVSFLCVEEKHRRCGVAYDLLKQVCEHGDFPRLYISTEEGNNEMLSLLEKLEATPIGQIDQLNFDDERELIFRLV